jgi:predicted nucleotidyltransferase
MTLTETESGIKELKNNFDSGMQEMLEYAQEKFTQDSAMIEMIAKFTDKQ